MYNLKLILVKVRVITVFTYLHVNRYINKGSLTDKGAIVLHINDVGLQTIAFHSIAGCVTPFCFLNYAQQCGY